MRLIILTLLLASIALCQAAHSNTLSWTWVPVAGDDPATGFKIKKGGSPTGPWFEIGSVSPSTFSFTDTVVAAGQTNFYILTVFNTGGESVPSNVVTCTTPFQAPTTPPKLSGLVK